MNNDKSKNENIQEELSNQISLILPQLNKTIIESKTLSILEILNKNKIMIYAPCGGKGVCGKCKVIVYGNVNPLTNEELKTLPAEEIKQGIRLACKTHINSAAEVRLLDTSLENHTKELISSHFQYSTNSRVEKRLITPENPTLENSYSSAECILHDVDLQKVSINILREVSNLDISKAVTGVFYNDKLISIETGDTTDFKYGIAIDIGTTTVACYLIDLNTGKQLTVQSRQNPQAGYGADVISRINYCIDDENGLKTLSKCIREGINELINLAACKAEIKNKFIYECILVGNTTMNHLFLGLNPVSLSQIPFNPVTKETIVVNASELEIKSINKNGKITFLPNIGGFVGSDTVGCIIEADLLENTKKCRVLIDLGTNGEIVLSSGNGVYACSTAAGPAFEGANISCGMQAFEGAINTFKIGKDFIYSTINNKPAKGICGSALIDITAEFLREGIISRAGKVVEPDTLENENIKKRIVPEGRNKKIIIAYAKDTEHNEDIYISQKDIREIQLAKAAIMSGIRILLRTAGLDIENVDEVLLAGAFGNFINKANSQKISLFPDIPLEKVISLGNAAGGGAKVYLTDKAYSRENLNRVFKRVKHVELSTHPDFQNEFVDNMLFQSLIP